MRIDSILPARDAATLVKKARHEKVGEVLQEILHRYAAIARRDAIAPAFEALLSVVDEVFPIELADVERARDVLLAAAQLSARDALHAAVMQRRGVEAILTFDAGFDALPGIRRLT